MCYVINIWRTSINILETYMHAIVNCIRLQIPVDYLMRMLAMIIKFVFRNDI